MAATLGTVQPFRYRGYVYDEELELYYLRSRYYKSIWQRFINADSLIVENLFQYCSNNPIIRTDQSGFDDDLCKTDDLGGGGYAPWLIPWVMSILGIGTGNIVKSEIEQEKRKNNGHIYTVYILQNDESAITYVGRVKTVFYSSRMAYHYRKRHLIEYYHIDDLTYEEARGLEEILMLSCHTHKGEFPWNIIHGIATNNPNRDLYFFDAISYLDNRAEDSLLNLFDSFGGF